MAEGEYVAQLAAKAGTSPTRLESRWVLYGNRSGGYHVESEIPGGPDVARVVQSQDLSEQMIPTAIAYDFYHEDPNKPAATVRCDFVRDSITCSGRSDEEGESLPSKPFKHNGPFWLWFEGLFIVDWQWLQSGVINMAHLEKGKTKIAMVSVDGGGKGDDWYFSVEEETLEFVGRESVEISGAKVSTKHYACQTEHFWIADPGILIAMGDGERITSVLANYKQYKKLIPELPVEPKPDKRVRQETK